MESRAEISKGGDAVKKWGKWFKKCSSPCKYSWWIMGDTTEGRVGEGWDMQGSPKVLTEVKILKSSYLPLFPPCLPGKCR